MKTLRLTDVQIEALKTAVNMSYDMHNDVLMEGFPTTRNEVEKLLSQSANQVFVEMNETFKQINKKIDNVIELARLQEKLKTL